MDCGLFLIYQSMSILYSYHSKAIYDRTGHDRDAFIYEYIGEVVSHPSFMKRMREYAEEGVKHFYFMMLQKDEVNVQISSLGMSLTSGSVY